jgi:hypothetical protein
LARKSTDGQRQQQQQQQQWYERGKSSKVALQKWAESSLWTFENKWFLLEAEDACCNNDVEAAKMYYDKAISSAKDHKVSKIEYRKIDLNRVLSVQVLLTKTLHLILLVPQRRSIGW